MSRRTATVVLPVALHARPAALLAREVAGHDAGVRIDDADAASVLDLLRLGARAGRRVRVEATGPDADEALEAVLQLVEGGLVGRDLGPEAHSDASLEAPAERHGTG